MWPIEIIHDHYGNDKTFFMLSTCNTDTNFKLSTERLVTLNNPHRLLLLSYDHFMSIRRMLILNLFIRRLAATTTLKMFNNNCHRHNNSTGKPAIDDGEEIEEYYVDVFGFLMMIRPRPYRAPPRYLWRINLMAVRLVTACKHLHVASDANPSVWVAQGCCFSGCYWVSRSGRLQYDVTWRRFSSAHDVKLRTPS